MANSFDHERHTGCFTTYCSADIDNHVKLFHDTVLTDNNKVEIILFYISDFQNEMRLQLLLQ